MSDEKKDFITELNETAEYNIKNKDFFGNDLKIFGDYDFIPVQENRQQQIRQAIKDIHLIIWPTAKNLQLIQNHIDLQDKVYNRIMWYTSDTNKCIKASRNVKEVNHCSDMYIQKLRNELKQEVIEILRDF